MKKMKRIASLLLAMVMVFAMSVTAFADEKYTITINNDKEGHTYEAYQIFAGTLDSTGTVLSDIVWGADVSENGKVALLMFGKEKGDDPYETPAELAAILTDGNKVAFADAAGLAIDETPTAKADTQTEGKYVISGLTPGYYLVKDKKASLDGKNDAYTSYILEVTNNATVNPKSAIPTVDKEVWDDEGADDGVWGETADHTLNDPFQFKLIAKLDEDENYYEYETYKVVFTDTMSTGVTFKGIASVTVDGVTLTADQYKHTADDDQAGGSWTLTIEDIKSINGVNLADGAEVVVIYNAVLNENAVIGNEDENGNKNKNTVYLQYSNNPNATGEGDSLGKTVEDTVWVFTYDLDVNKVDGTDNNIKLKDAEFVLSREGKDGKEYVIVNEEGKVVEWKKDEKAASILRSNSEGLFTVIGLDDGTYSLKETKAPDGYNLLTTEIEVVISAEHSENEAGTTATTVVKVNGTEDGFITVENNKGTELPETGGIGTTIFYLIGGTFVIAAAVLLVTRKRMNHEA